MRILHVLASDSLRGAEIFASDLVRRMARSGIAQRVAVLHPVQSARVAFECEVDLLARPSDEHSAARLEARAAAALRRLVKDFEPGVIQVHGGGPLKCAVLGAAGTGVNIVYRRIGSGDGRTIGALRRRLHGRLMSVAARIVVMSDHGRRELIDSFGIAPDRIVSIPNAVDPDRLAPRRTSAEVRNELGIDADARVMLSIGAFTWEKDPLGQIELARRVFDVVPTARFVMAGRGPLWREAEERIRSQGLTGRVLLPGATADVADLLGAADALLLASRTEGMPGVAIEAGMSGVPVAGYALSGLPEVLVDGETGILAEPGDESAVAAAMVSLLTDEALRLRMGRLARDRCLSRFHIADAARNYLRLYDGLVPARARIGT